MSLIKREQTHQQDAWRNHSSPEESRKTSFPHAHAPLTQNHSEAVQVHPLGLPACYLLPPPLFLSLLVAGTPLPPQQQACQGARDTFLLCNTLKKKMTRGASGKAASQSASVFTSGTQSSYCVNYTSFHMPSTHSRPSHTFSPPPPAPHCVQLAVPHVLL